MIKKYIVILPNSDVIAKDVNVLDAAHEILIHNVKNYSMRRQGSIWKLMVSDQETNRMIIARQGEGLNFAPIISQISEWKEAAREIAAIIVSCSYERVWAGSPIAIEISKSAS